MNHVMQCASLFLPRQLQAQASSQQHNGFALRGRVQQDIPANAAYSRIGTQTLWSTWALRPRPRHLLHTKRYKRFIPLIDLYTVYIELLVSLLLDFLSRRTTSDACDFLTAIKDNPCPLA